MNPTLEYSAVVVCEHPAEGGTLRWMEILAQGTRLVARASELTDDVPTTEVCIFTAANTYITTTCVPVAYETHFRAALYRARKEMVGGITP